jgi:hypothetical protein
MFLKNFAKKNPSSAVVRVVIPFTGATWINQRERNAPETLLQ